MQRPRLRGLWQRYGGCADAMTSAVSIFARRLSRSVRTAADHYAGDPLVLRTLELAHPLPKVKKFLGTFNERTVFEDDRPHTWLCADIGGIRRAGHWEVTWAFRYKPGSWDLLTSGGTFCPYVEADFFEMGIAATEEMDAPTP